MPDVSFYKELLSNLDKNSEILLLHPVDNNSVFVFYPVTNNFFFCDFTKNTLLLPCLSGPIEDILDHIPNDMDSEHCRDIVRTCVDRIRKMYHSNWRMAHSEPVDGACL